MNAPRDTGYEASLLQSLKDPEEAAAYVDAVMGLEDPAALLLALRQVAKAHGMAEVARRADVGDKTLFRALSDNGLRRATHSTGCVWVRRLWCRFACTNGYMVAT